MVKKEYVVDEVVKLMFDPEHIRNIAIVAHVDHGKTTLTDSLVARAGLISTELAGEQRGMDFDEQEQARGITIKAANISLGFTWEGKDYLVNLIDTPGHVDFGGHVTRAMRAVDGIVLVVDAVEGIMPQTETVLRQALKEKAKPSLFINKIDRLINELKVSPQEMQERLIKVINGVNKIIASAATDEFRDAWMLSVEKGNVAMGSAYNKWAISVTAMKKFGISFRDIYNYCEKGDHKTLTEKAPIDDVILEMCIKNVPNPAIAQKYRIPVIWKGDPASQESKWMTSCDHTGKVCGVIFGVVNDEHAGEVAVARIFSGVAKKGVDLFIASRFTYEKVQQVGVFMGPDRVLVEEVPAGNIAAIVCLRDVYVGETISETQMDPFEQIKHYSEPVVTKSIEAKNTKDLAKLITALRAISKEDPTLRVQLDQNTGEHLISGMGELHLEIIEYKITKEKGIPITTSPPIVVYHETITSTSPTVEGKSPNKHTKIKCIVEKLPPEIYQLLIDGKIANGRPKGKQMIEDLVKAGMDRKEAKGIVDISNNNMLVDGTKGVQYLNEIMELLIQAFEEAVNQGPLAKEKVTGIRVTIEDATIHEDPVHRGPAQIIPAFKRAIYAGTLLAGTTLLEPKQKVLVQVPQDYMGNVITMMQGRRGTMIDINQEGETATVNFKMPVAEMFGFSNEIRSATQGKAIWYQEYLGYEPLPRDMMEKVVRQIRERKGEPKDPPTAQFFMD
ncbi:Elongation factor 2 [Candidatus Gugararchaeum adminiculabundum]|nr:Elongation factor 2 [Candidatus Gugararchaeum adminiculabundum]